MSLKPEVVESFQASILTVLLRFDENKMAAERVRERDR